MVGFWIGVSAFGVAIRAARAWAPRVDAPEWFAVGAVVALVCAPYSLVLFWMFDGFAWRWPRPEQALIVYGEALLLAAPMTAATIVIHRHRAALAAARSQAAPATEGSGLRTTAEIAAPTTSALLDRLPPRLGRELIALQMEDHYVRAHTPRGSELLLMPMSQAVEELGGIDGLRIHRSWWVARAAVEQARLDGRNLRLRLQGGLEAPVARAQIAPLRAAGWPTEPAENENRAAPAV